MSNSLVQFRVDEKIKNDATKLYENLGIDLSTAIKLFLKKSINKNGMPFDINNFEPEIIDGNNKYINKLEAFEELDRMNSINKNISDEDAIYDALMEKYESIN